MVAKELFLAVIGVMRDVEQLVIRAIKENRKRYMFVYRRMIFRFQFGVAHKLYFSEPRFHAPGFSDNLIESIQCFLD